MAKISYNLCIFLLFYSNMNTIMNEQNVNQRILNTFSETPLNVNDKKYVKIFDDIKSTVHIIPVTGISDDVIYRKIIMWDNNVFIHFILAYFLHFPRYQKMKGHEETECSPHTEIKSLYSSIFKKYIDDVKTAQKDPRCKIFYPDAAILGFSWNIYESKDVYDNLVNRFKNDVKPFLNEIPLEDIKTSCRDMINPVIRICYMNSWKSYMSIPIIGDIAYRRTQPKISAISLIQKLPQGMDHVEKRILMSKMTLHKRPPWENAKI